MQGRLVRSSQGMITFKEGTLHQVSLGRGLALNGLPPLHVYVSHSAAALGGSTRQTRMLSQVEVSSDILIPLLLLLLKEITDHAKLSQSPAMMLILNNYNFKLWMELSSFESFVTQTFSFLTVTGIEM